LATATVAFAARAASAHGLDTVALTGGVFQNALLSEQIASGLSALGLEVLTHGAIPPNDGGISVGQAAVAAFTSRV
jgi:hydrogenase maturation protein HypF